MMRLGHCTARRALTQAAYTTRATQSIRIGTFSTCSVHRHSTPPVRQATATIIPLSITNLPILPSRPKTTTCNSHLPHDDLF